MIRLLLGKDQKVYVELTSKEARRLRDHLVALFPLPAPIQQSDAAQAALAVEAARRTA